jgi:uncharacterized protein
MPVPGVPLRKKARLITALKRCSRILVAFSGGKDSFFLAREASLALGRGRVVVCTVETPFSGEGARARLKYFRRLLPLPIRVLRLELPPGSDLLRNPRNRCYICKRLMFSRLKQEAALLGGATVMDGSTRSDSTEHRPGRRALKQLAVASPLSDAGITSAEIAGELAAEGIGEYYLTSSTCLATRFPYDHRLDAAQLRTIGQVEHYLARRGVSPLRVRHIPDGVRIEAGPEHFHALLALRERLLAFCRARGLRFITLDLGGLQSGPWDKSPNHSRKKKRQSA